MIGFNDLATSGINRIYEEDFDSQKVYLREWVQGSRTSPYEPLFKARAFYVPNNEYMLQYFGESALSPRYNLYTWDNVCVWHGFIVFPIRSVGGSIVGFAGYDPEAKIKRNHGEGALENSYKYSTQDIFQRSNYSFMLPGVFEKSVEEGYIILTDGIFDMLTLSHFGFNSASLLGSLLSDQLLMVLNFIPTLFLAYDNDNAGKVLFDKLSKLFPGRLFPVTQNLGKDIDAALSGPHSEELISGLKNGIANKRGINLRLKPQRPRMTGYTTMR